METAIARQNRQRESQKLLLNATIPDTGLEKALSQQADNFLAQFGTFSYDRGLITEINYSGVAKGHYRYRYDNNFFLVGVKLDDRPETILQRDADGLLVQLGDFQMERQGCYDLLTGIRDGFLQVSLEYDNIGRIVKRTHAVKGRVIYQLSLGYDGLYQIVQKQETVLGKTKTYDYTLDRDGQLIRVAEKGVVVESYSYDDNGNRIYWQLGSANPQTAKYDSQDRILEFGNVAYQFDDDGFMTQRGATAFEYSSRGELTKVMLPDGKVISYAYDGVGRRVARSSYAGTYEYLYGNPEKPFQVTAIREPSGVLTVYYYDDFGLLFAMQRDEDWFYVATDQLGTPIVVVDTGETVKVVKYDSFGNQVADSNSGFVLPIGFAAGLVDWETKLVRFGFRDYDPASGRWCAKDPIGFAAGDSNLYRYVNLNPVGFVDRSGEDGESILDYIPSLKTSEQNNLESIINRKPPVCDGSAQIKSPAENDSIQIDWDFISEREGGGRTEGYVPDPEGSQSGVTIATGFDLGARNRGDLERLGLSEDLIEKLEPYLGRKKSGAVDFIENNPLTITYEQVRTIDRLVKASAMEKLERLYNNTSDIDFRALPPEAQTVIASVAFQYGNLETRTPNFWRQVTQQDWLAAYRNLRNFGDDYRSRRNLEADYLEPLVQ